MVGIKRLRKNDLILVGLAAFIQTIVTFIAPQILLAAETPICTGEEIASQEPFQIDSGPLNYPRRALNRGIQGYVFISMDIELDGTVSNVQVVCSSEPGWGFEEAAIRSAKHSRFEPQQAVRNSVVKRFGFGIVQ